MNAHADEHVDDEQHGTHSDPDHQSGLGDGLVDLRLRLHCRHHDIVTCGSRKELNILIFCP